MNILGIETSCDDTCSSIVKDGHEILSNIVVGQNNVHKKYGGIVPELASREHLDNIEPVYKKALEDANLKLNDIDLIAVTARRGLAGSLFIGVGFAKALAYSNKKPIVSINHIHAHIYTGILANKDIEFPHLCLSVSGGHSMILKVNSVFDYEIIGKSIDDSAGEAFDKVAKYCDLGFPGGPIIEKLAENGDEKVVKFPRPMSKDPNLNFSFSGLKTSVLYYLHKNKNFKLEDVLASFQLAVLDSLVIKLKQAVKETGIKHISLVGGVSANKVLRNMIDKLAKKDNLKFYSIPMTLCSDNAAMVAGLGYYINKEYGTNSLDFDIEVWSDR